MKTVVAIGTFGNLEFTKLAVRSIRETHTYTGNPDDLAIAVIVGKPDDEATLRWVKLERGSNPEFHWLKHDTNKGFPVACNDMIDFAFNRAPLMQFDNLIILGNDVVVYPGAIDAMIECAKTTDYEWICASQYDAQSLRNEFPEARQFFKRAENIFTDFDARPWDLKLPHVLSIPPEIRGNRMSDVQNCCLFKKSVFGKLGYFDANFWPNGYFSDNDFCYRAVQAGVKGCALPHAAYFHFGSRTMHQEPSRAAIHDGCFQRNAQFYQSKWGGLPDAEKFKEAFGGKTHYKLGACEPLPCEPLKITTRFHENEVVGFWSQTKFVQA